MLRLLCFLCTPHNQPSMDHTNTTTEKSITPSVALVVGATGMAGISLAEALRKPTAPGGPWTILGASRRPSPPWFPSSVLDRYLQIDALDPASTAAALSPLSTLITHVFYAALAALSTDEADVAANTAMLSNILRALTSPPGSALRHVTLQTGTKHYMGPFVHSELVGKITPAELPFRESFPRLPHPLFYYSQEDLLASYSSNLSWSVHRSSIILGASARSIYNALLTLCAYALICKREGSLFRFPGSKFAWSHFCDATDAELLAEQQIWAATSEAAKYEAFNCTNGDVFTWRSFWGVLAEEFSVEAVGPDEKEEEEDWVGWMRGKGDVWAAIVAEEKLCETKLEEISCFEAVYAVLNFGFQHVCCVNKSREFGFHGSVDTLKSVKKWIGRLRKMMIIP